MQRERERERGDAGKARVVLRCLKTRGVPVPTPIPLLHPHWLEGGSMHSLGETGEEDEEDGVLGPPGPPAEVSQSQLDF